MATTKPKTVVNVHKVAKSVWRKWSADQRAMFNALFQDITNLGPELFLHPVTVQRKLSADEFKTIAWNAAWNAVSIMRDEIVTEVTTLYQGRVISVDPVKKRAA